LDCPDTKILTSRKTTSTTDTHYTYDTLGRLIAVTILRRNGSEVLDIDTAASGNQPDITSYTYDLTGNLDQVRLPNGVINDYNYDSLNRLELLRQFKDLDGDFVFDDANGDYFPDTGDDLFLGQYSRKSLSYKNNDRIEDDVLIICSLLSCPIAFIDPTRNNTNAIANTCPFLSSSISLPLIAPIDYCEG
jgi:YD repeat-containing protein